jgi:23S rRNA maturation mini-RNase III
MQTNNVSKLLSNNSEAEKNMVTRGRKAKTVTFAKERNIWFIYLFIVVCLTTLIQ